MLRRIGICLLILLPLGTHAEALSVPSGTSIDTINSITLIDSFTTPIQAMGDYRVMVFGLTFSIQAFKDAVSIPLRAGMMDPEALVQYVPHISFETQSRYADAPALDSILSAATLVPKTAAINDRMVIPSGTKGEATLLVAFAAKPHPDREDRIQITNIPLYFGTSTAPLMLNPSEVAELKTPYSALGM